MPKPNFSPLQTFLKRAVISIIVVIVLSGLGFWGYTQFAAYSPDPQALNTALNDTNVDIQEKNSYFIITPKDVNLDLNSIIFYPGGLVRPHSYLFKMVEISKQVKTRVFLVKSPFNLAFFDIGIAGKIISENSLDKPILSGHSLGAVAACRYVKDNQQNISGLYLYGSYCDQSITDFKGLVLSVAGQNDQVLNRQSYEKAKSNLPSQTVFREVDDLNHASFGNYGAQKGDGESSLSVAEVATNMIL